ncbi:hypothetical protein ABPG75_010377 [Micractinium tetrahymenae]
MDDYPPLILSSRAARRLRLLQVPGLPPAAAAAVAATASAPFPGLLTAALLAEPAPAPSGEWQRERDPLAELAVTVGTLRALQLPAGALVQVANAARPRLAPRLARLLALPAPATAGAGAGAGAGAADPKDGTAYLAPSLAFNLGLALHLWPLLHGDQQQGEQQAAEQQAGQRQVAAPAAFDRVLVQRYSPPLGLAVEEEDQGQQQQEQWRRLLQPGDEPAAVPVAAEVQVAVVRLPQAAVLLQQRPERGSTHSGSQAGWRGSGGAGAADGPADGQAAGSSAEEAIAAGAGGGGGAAASAAADDAVAALQQWFLVAPRVVSEGDVLAVPRVRGAGGSSATSSGLLPSLLPNLHASAGVSAGPAAAAAPPELLYFKIAKLVLPEGLQQAAGIGPACAAAAVDVGSTAVKLAGSCSSALPVGLPYYLAAAGAAGPAAAGPTAGGLAPADREAGGSSGSSSTTNVSSPALGVHASAAAAPAPLLPPAGPLLPAWRPLAQLLASALHPGTAGLPLRLAVLLHGPAGCGKRTAAAAAAAATGSHLVSLSCHDIKAAAGAAERHTFEGLRAAFAAAAGYAPAVLLLRQFSVLGDGSSHGGSGSASAHSYAARLGSVLADCIRAHGSGGSRWGGSSSSSGGTSGSAGSTDQQGTAAPPASPVILVACAASAEDLPAPLRRCFTHELALEAPDQAQRLSLLAGSLGGVPAAPDWAADAAESGASAAPAGGEVGQLDGESLGEAALHTAGLLPRELRAVAADAAAAAAVEALPPAAVLNTAEGGAAAALDGSNGCPQNGAAQAAATPAVQPALSQEHLVAAVDAVRQRTATDIGAPKIPSVRWEDVGGLQDIKRAILDTVELPLKHPELFAGGLRRRSGVLLYGPPGTGKTLLAKTVATECSISFLSVKGPELINMYVGESERQIREVFARARRARPCVVFFDELDSLAPARGRGSDSGGVMDRVVSQLLAEIDGVQGSGAGDVFLIGATNRPDLLDAALLRPGRLDKLLYVGIASDVPSRLQVLQALARRFRMAPGVDLEQVAARCADRFTGADLYALCSDAWMTALKRSIACLEARQGKGQCNGEEHGSAANGSVGTTEAGAELAEEAEEAAEEAAAEGEPEVEVTQADFLAAADSLQPSLSLEEVAKYERIRDQYQQQR